MESSQRCVFHRKIPTATTGSMRRRACRALGSSREADGLDEGPASLRAPGARLPQAWGRAPTCSPEASSLQSGGAFLARREELRSCCCWRRRRKRSPPVKAGREPSLPGLWIPTFPPGRGRPRRRPSPPLPRAPFQSSRARRAPAASPHRARRPEVALRLCAAQTVPSAGGGTTSPRGRAGMGSPEGKGEAASQWSPG